MCKFCNDLLLSEKEILFSGAMGHRVDYQGRFINRYYEPLKEADKFCFVEYGRNDRSKRYSEKIVEIEKYLTFYSLKNRIQNTRKHISAPGLSEFNVLLKENGLEYLTVTENTMHNYSRQVALYAEAYTEIIKKVKPKVIYGLCYYSPAMFGLFYAANRLGVENYDIQHGGQGALHPMYTFGNFPATGLNILPQKFWLWNSDSYEHIQQWLPQNGYHSAEIKGNPWLDFVLSSYNDSINADEKIILYTMQYPLLDDYILEAIKNTPPGFKWWLRLHPRMKDKESVNSQLRELNLEGKVEIDLATELSFPALLKVCSLHVSKYSGSIIEAELMNKHSIILEEIGCETYKEIISRGNATGLLNPTSEEIINCIATLS